MIRTLRDQSETSPEADFAEKQGFKHTANPVRAISHATLLARSGRDFSFDGHDLDISSERIFFT